MQKVYNNANSFPSSICPKTQSEPFKVFDLSREFEHHSYTVFKGMETGAFASTSPGAYSAGDLMASLRWIKNNAYDMLYHELVGTLSLFALPVALKEIRQKARRWCPLLASLTTRFCMIFVLVQQKPINFVPYSPSLFFFPVRQIAVCSTLMLVEGAAVVPILAGILYLCMKAVRESRIALFSIFLMAPRPVVLTLATREIKLDEDER